MAYDLYNGIIQNDNIDKRLIQVKPRYVLRANRRLVESTSHDYAYKQPMAKIIQRVNEYGDYMSLGRTRFKMEVEEMIRGVVNDDVEN